MMAGVSGGAGSPCPREAGDARPGTGRAPCGDTPGGAGSPCPRDLPPPGFLSRFTHVDVWHGDLPHWERSGVAVFITMRLGDSLPMDKLGPWMSEKDEWLQVHPQPWTEETSREFSSKFRGAIEKWLDEGHGTCVFGDESARKVVEDALRHYAGRRYALYAFVVMPNHVHVLLMPLEGWTVKRIVADLKHYTARVLAACRTWEGAFWQREYWDTAIRNGEHFRRVIRYIKGNRPDIAFDAYATRG